MADAQSAFGWLQEPIEVSDQYFEIRLAQRFKAAVAEVKGCKAFGESWIEMPIQEQGGVPVPVGRFTLPCTHILVTPDCSYDRAFGDYLVLMLGFFLGRRLTPEGTGHLLPTPHKDHTLVNFTPWKKELPLCLRKCAGYWESATDEQRKLLFSAVHWFLTSQSYRHQHEEFTGQYSVLDNLHRITEQRSTTYNARFPSGNKSHGHRPVALAAEYGSPLPPGFAYPNDATRPVARLVDMRNQLAHEARWVGEPLGYAATQDANTVIAELKQFNSQLILGVLDIQSPFRRLAYNRQLAALDFGK